mmetsp:Transcript_52001/g.113294  ORF Transcript_52001/g.113294 Transcript_52001/m.113294 type:complete len:203 (+) Transcript_52001:1160-1768(+)
MSAVAAIAIATLRNIIQSHQDLFTNEDRQTPESQHHQDEVVHEGALPKQVLCHDMDGVTVKEGQVVLLLITQRSEHFGTDQIRHQDHIDVCIDDWFPIASIHPGFMPSWCFPHGSVEVPLDICLVFRKVPLGWIEDHSKAYSSGACREADASGQGVPGIFALRRHGGVAQQGHGRLGRLAKHLGNALLIQIPGHFHSMFFVL